MAFDLMSIHIHGMIHFAKERITNNNKPKETLVVIWNMPIVHVIYMI